MNGLKVIVADGQDDVAKLTAIVHSEPTLWKGTVLDVGARSGVLKGLLPNTTNYVGLDLRAPTSVIGDLQSGLPFIDQSFSTVLALDVLEHTDDIYRSFREICRVAHEHVAVCLPNAFEIRSRIRFLGGRISGKYGLPVTPPNDRHKWIFTFTEARRFVNHNCSAQGFKVSYEACLIGKSRKSVGTHSITFFPDLIAQWYFTVLSRY